jgi:hypothetical protein
MLGCTICELWWDYFSLGGSRSESELAAMLANEEPIERADQQLVATALNERFASWGLGHPVTVQGPESDDLG